jgi:hypothetical protein
MGAHVGDHAGPLVTRDRPDLAPALEHEVEVAAADAAAVDLDEHVVRTELRYRHVLDLEHAGAAQHCGRHRPPHERAA